MKKLLTLVLPLVILLSACQKNNYVTPNKTIITDLPLSSWRSYDGGRSYEASVYLPEVDQFALERGGILVYISFDRGQTYEQVPQVYDGVSYSFALRAGTLSLTYENANGAPVSRPGSDATLKIILLESDY
ncbi:hypothetical protein [Arcticibacter sp. MXS-1]|uniref:hypothetical protein n=1 Tax=Arcticibacter sp. MXS-1 TaxID=3341726 RepID=UPI0035A9ACCF